MPIGALAPIGSYGLTRFASLAAPFLGMGSRTALKGTVGGGLAASILGGLDLTPGFDIPGFPSNGSAAQFGSPVVKRWNTGTAEFFELQNGRIGTVKKNGVVKTWRPYHPVVIPKHWNAKAMRRVERSLKRQQKTAMQIVRMAGGEASATKRARRAAAPSHRGGGKVTMYSND